MKTITAEDQFAGYYTEKLWEMIPAIYRHEDGIAEEPGVLRSLVEVLAEQAAILRRSQDRLWEDQFIAYCNDWAVPYIADLVGTRLLTNLNKRGQRIDVAKTIYYRRRKGTLRVLEELISDISGWEGKVVENFLRLARARHGLDLFPTDLAGRFSKTMPGGWADLRHPRISELVGSPFDEYFHTPDVRQHQGQKGRYNIPKLAVHLYRLIAYPVQDVTPFSLGDKQRFTFDPSGRSIPLFSRRDRPDDWDEWHSALEWELPAPIRCRLLGDIDGGKQALLPNTVVVTPSGEIILDHWSLYVVTPLPADVVTTKDCTAANLDNWQPKLPKTDKNLLIDPERGRFAFPTALTATDKVGASYYYGFSGPFGAGTYSRLSIKKLDPTIVIKKKSGGGEIKAIDILNKGLTQIEDNKTYGPIADKDKVEDLTLQAADEHRPYLRLDSNWVLTTKDKNALLTLDGLWIGGEGNNTKCNIILKGDYDCVTIQHCTLDPGGSKNINNETLYPVTLSIEGTVRQLCISHSILGPLSISGAGLVESVSIEDSIVHSVNDAFPAIDLQMGELKMERVTVFGRIKAHRLQASEVLVTKIVDVKDTQSGCFRFSAAPTLPLSRLPKPYESFLFKEDSNHWFTSQIFGQPGYAQLSETIPIEILRGAENGAEMGVFCSLINPIKSDNLKTKIEEYMPFGLISLFIHKT